MTTLPPVGPSVAGDAGPRAAARDLVLAAALCAVVVLLQVAVMPYLAVADGMPDLIAPMVVMVAMLRGTLAGAVLGTAAGLLVELTAPVGTLGALALLYLGVGAFAGRYAGRRESATLMAPLGLSVAAAGVVQMGYALLQALLDNVIPPSELVARILIPTLVLTALLSAPVLLAARRLLRARAAGAPTGVS